LCPLRGFEGSVREKLKGYEARSGFCARPSGFVGRSRSCRKLMPYPDRIKLAEDNKIVWRKLPAYASFCANRLEYYQVQRSNKGSRRDYWMSSNEWIQGICAATFPISVAGIILERIISGRGIGVRAIQFLAAAMVIPGIIILVFAGKLDGSTAAALVGAFIGYLFSTITKFDDK
jgi:hypothetical protein